MAVRALAWRYRVRSRQGKARAVVIEGRVQPRTRVVALIAALGEVRSHVVWVCRSLVVLQVTAHAGGAGEVVVVVDVAIRALTRGHRVHPRQWEVRHVVIERRVRPRGRVVTLSASLGEVGRDVVRIHRALIILQVTAYASCAREIEVVVDVAVGALPGRNCVSACQREAYRTVIEVRVEPSISAMAYGAIG